MRQNRVHLMPPMSNFYARICVKATPSSNMNNKTPDSTTAFQFFNPPKTSMPSDPSWFAIAKNDIPPMPLLTLSTLPCPDIRRESANFLPIQQS